MRVRVSDPRFLLDLCDFLSRRGWVAVEVGEDEADILIPRSFEAVAMLMSEIGIWRAKLPACLFPAGWWRTGHGDSVGWGSAWLSRFLGGGEVTTAGDSQR